MDKQIGWYKEVDDKFFCDTCFSQTESLSKDDYRPVYRDDLNNNIYTCDKCGKEEKRGAKSIFAKMIQVIGWFFLIIGGISLLPIFFGVDYSSHAGEFSLFIGLPLLITGLLLVCLGKIWSKNKILNLFFAISIIILIILVINYFWNILEVFQPIIMTRCERIKEEAIKTKNPGKCSEIQAVPFVSRDLSIFLFRITEEYYLCPKRTECISKIAASEKDIKICEIIKAVEIGARHGYESCITEVAVVAGDESICDDISMCYWKVAVVEQDSTLCEKAHNRFDRSRCYTEIAVAKADSDLCEKIIYKEDDINKDVRHFFFLAECYQEIAIIREDPELCKKIPYMKHYTLRNTCYSKIVGIAIKKLKPDLCEGIGELYSLSRCYTEIAVAENNPELCEKIPSQSEYYQDCLNKVGNK